MYVHVGSWARVPEPPEGGRGGRIQYQGHVRSAASLLASCLPPPPLPLPSVGLGWRGIGRRGFPVGRLMSLNVYIITHAQVFVKRAFFPLVHGNSTCRKFPHTIYIEERPLPPVPYLLSRHPHPPLNPYATLRARTNINTYSTPKLSS